MIRSMNEFNKKYFPEAYKKEQEISLMENPVEFGKKLGKDILRDIEERLDDKPL